MDYHSWGDDFRPAHSAAYLAFLAYLVANLGAWPEPLRATCPEGDLAAYPDASSADEPYEGMHDKMAKSCLNPVEPYCIPYRCCTVVEAEGRHYMRDGESRGAETHGEESHDATSAGGVEGHHYQEQMIGSLG
jgi:hypothetical protein